MECYYQGNCIAKPLRSYRQGGHTTLAEHMPKAHRKHLEWTPGRFMNWAKQIGPYTLQLVQHLLENRPHPERGYRSCLGLLSLAKRYGEERLEKACERGWQQGMRTRKSIQSILEHKLDLQTSDASQLPTTYLPAEHENGRGSQYYH